MKSILINSLKNSFPINPEFMIDDIRSLTFGRLDHSENIYISKFVGKMWPDLDVSIWFGDSSYTSILKPQALFYFIPSLIIATTVNMELASKAVENVLDDFGRRRGYGVGLEQDMALYNLSLPQIWIILGWIQWVASCANLDIDITNIALDKIIKIASSSENIGFKFEETQSIKIE